MVFLGEVGEAFDHFAVYREQHEVLVVGLAVVQLDGQLG